MRPVVIATQRAAHLRTTPSSLPIATIASPRPKSSLCPSRSKTHPHDTAMPSSLSKRPADDTNDPSISPPPVKRRAQIQSNVTKSTVASFFTPTSQKPNISAKVDWSQHSPNNGPATLLLGRYHTSTKYGTEDASVKRTRVAAFDLDGTLITTASGKKFSDDPTDWKWWDPTVRTKLRTLYDEGFRVILFSNQNGLVLEHDAKTKGPKNSKRLPNWKQKLTAILTELDIPLSIYAATAKDGFRKPCTGMWDQMCRDYKLDNKSITKEESFFIGDAGGRVARPSSGSAKAIAKDFSCSDRNFAHNVGLRFETPEEFFLDQPPRDFQRDFDLSSYPHEDQPSDIVFEKKFDTELVVFSGPPGAGKSTFFWRYLQPLGYVRVNQDELKTRDKCVKAAKALLEQGKSVAVDNTNSDPDTRKIWVELAKHLRDSGASNVTPRCLWFRTPIPVAEHNNAARSRNPSINPEARDLVPKLAFNTFSSRFKEPNAVKESFADVIPVDFEYRGSKEEFAIWSQYWS